MAYKRKGSYAGARSVRRKLFGGARGRSRTRFGTKGRSKMAKVAKRVILKMTEAKTLEYNFGKIELFHNVRLSPGYLNAYTGRLPVQGTGDHARNGNRINVSGVQVRMMLGQKNDRPNCTWRIMVLKHKDTYASFASVYEATTGNCLLDQVNDDAVKVLYSKTIHKFVGANVGVAEAAFRETTFTHKFYIPIRKEYKFPSDSSVIASNSDYISLIVMCYDAYGTLVTDNIGYVQTWSKLFYRDP